MASVFQVLGQTSHLGEKFQHAIAAGAEEALKGWACEPGDYAEGSSRYKRRARAAYRLGYALAKKVSREARS